MAATVLNRGWGPIVSGCGGTGEFLRRATPVARAAAPHLARVGGWVGGRAGGGGGGSANGNGARKNAGLKVKCLFYYTVK